MHSEKTSADHLEKIRRLEEQIQDFESLESALETIWSASRVEEVLRRINETALRICNADQGSIMLIDSGEHEAKTLFREKETGETKLDHYLNKLLAGWVYHHKKPLITNELTQIFERENIKPKYADIASAMSFPLLLEGKVIGVINLISQDVSRKFGKREERLLNILSAQCARFIRNARLHEELFAETFRLKKEVQDKYALYGIIGQSPKMQSVFSLLERVIPLDVRVLLSGESGTGKELIARVIHYSGLRKDTPFVTVDCGALPANLLESELFGYLKGAFTGANSDRKGLFEEAHGGTLFLDEITNMPLEIQVKFLRAIQEGEIRPLGTSRVRKVDVRIIAAASNNLQEAVTEGKFREDLYYRLNVVNIALPPLRERQQDIVLLATHFLKCMNERYGKHIKGFQPGTMASLESYHWPGNIRELEHAVERAVVLCEGNRLGKADFPFLQSIYPAMESFSEPMPLQQALTSFKKRYVAQILENTGGNQKQAAEVLQIQRTYLNRLIKDLRISK
jgi:Nif-specific regulatory protein